MSHFHHVGGLIADLFLTLKLPESEGLINQKYNRESETNYTPMYPQANVNQPWHDQH